MKVSFIIPLYNCLAHTQAMLASLRATLPPGLTHEIVLVDDGSTDGTRAWLAQKPTVYQVMLNEKNMGFAGACNRGAAAATGEHLFFLNNDLVLQPGWLEPMLAVLTQPSSAALVGNVQLNAASGAVDHTGIFFNLKGKPEHDTCLPLVSRLLPFASCRTVDALTGACFGIRRAVWQQLGGFDAGYINGGEDIDLCLRARAAGLRNCIALRSVVRHHISASPGRKLRDEQNTRRLVLRWHDTIASRITRLWCWHHLAAHWAEPRDYPDPRLARMALYYALHLRSAPPFAAVAGARRIVTQELARWRKMFPDPA
jgi:GT2 family glycosyltransferase